MRTEVPLALKRIGALIPETVSPIKELDSVFRKWFIVADPDVIRVVMAAVVANRLSGDALWFFLITCPSGLKTELINSLSGLPDIHPLSDLTAQTFASGMKTKGPDPSLLSKLKYGAILTLKDRVAELLDVAAGE